MKTSEVLQQFMANLKQVEALDNRVGFTREEMEIHIQAVFLRASAQLFGRDQKAEFARTAKIAWDAVHNKTPKPWEVRRERES